MITEFTDSLLCMMSAGTHTDCIGTQI